MRGLSKTTKTTSAESTNIIILLPEYDIPEPMSNAAMRHKGKLSRGFVSQHMEYSNDEYNELHQVRSSEEMVRRCYIQVDWKRPKGLVKMAYPTDHIPTQYSQC